MRTQIAVIGVLTVLLVGVLVGGAASQSGNRIWEEGDNTTYTWNSFSFSGFYYNLDNNLSTEELTINNINNRTRSIKEGDVTYKTSPIDVSFDYSAFGSYKVIGFMADKYFAGYTTSSIVSENKEINTIGNGQLQRILLDEENRHVVSVGGTLTLQDGYVLKMKEIDVGAGPGQVMIGLLKDGTEIDSSVVVGGQNYIYSKKVGSMEDLPIIAIHLDTVFRGTEANAVFIKGIFQISDSYTSISTNDRYGIMELTEASNNLIRMENKNVIDLSPGDTIDLMGNLKIIVADNNNILRFALSIEKTGIYEVRGTIYPVTKEWTPLNFGLNIGGGTSVGFYYDMDKGIGTEDLKASVSGNNIPKDSLEYSTSPQVINFDYDGFGKYNVIGFLAEKYFAGYTQNSNISGNKEINTLTSGQLHKVLLDDSEQRVATEGGTITLKDGYILKIKAVDIGAGPGQVFVNLLKDGSQVDDSVVAGGETYIYSKKVGSVSDLPIISVHFANVFRGTEVNAVFTKGIFQISEDVTSVKSGDSYGAMEIDSVDQNGIKMSNPSSIGLSPGSVVDIMGNIKFRIADSQNVRFYPFVQVTPEMAANQLVIEAPTQANAGDTIKIKVTAQSIPIAGVSLSIGNLSIGETDSTGVIQYTIPKTLQGTYNISATKVSATKLGYGKVSKTIEIIGYVANRLSIDVPTITDQFKTITIHVSYNETPISDANIAYDNTTIGMTDENGDLNYAPQESGTHTITASKTNYTTTMVDIDVRVPFSEFKALDIKVTPDTISTGQTITVNSNITNVGTKKDTIYVPLIINGTEVDNKSVTLAANDIESIIFTDKITLGTGNYTVEVLGQKGQLGVTKKAPSIGVTDTIGVIIIIYGLIYYRRRLK